MHNHVRNVKNSILHGLKISRFVALIMFGVCMVMGILLGWLYSWVWLYQYVLEMTGISDVAMIASAMVQITILSFLVGFLYKLALMYEVLKIAKSDSDSNPYEYF